jgi:hypothetical protein
MPSLPCSSCAFRTSSSYASAVDPSAFFLKNELNCILSNSEFPTIVNMLRFYSALKGNRDFYVFQYLVALDGGERAEGLLKEHRGARLLLGALARHDLHVPGGVSWRGVAWRGVA